MTTAITEHTIEQLPEFINQQPPGTRFHIRVNASGWGTDAPVSKRVLLEAVKNLRAPEGNRTKLIEVQQSGVFFYVG